MEINNPSKRYKSKNHLIYSCQYHVIFCTKYRRKVLSTEIQEKIRELILQKQEECDYEIIEMEIMEDHVHLLLDVNPKLGVYKTISRIKGFTSHEMRAQFPELKQKLPSLWTNSKFVSTVGAVSLETVKKYIEEQKPKWTTKLKTNK